MRQLLLIAAALQEVYSQKLYFFITIVFSALVFSFNLLINNYKIIFSNFSFSFIFAILKGSVASRAVSSLIFLIIISILAGIVFSFSIFLMRREYSSFQLGTGISGTIVSLAAPACPSCAVGLLSFLSISGFLAILPFKGLELNVLGIAILLFLMSYVSKKITAKTCEMDYKQNRMC